MLRPYRICQRNKGLKTLPTTVAIIPAYNEEQRIKKTIEACLALKEVDQVVVVDDGSTDNTKEAARGCGARVLVSPRNEGKGQALSRAISAVNADVYVFLDADLGESASNIKELINPVIFGRADMAIALFPPAVGKGGFGLVKGLARLGIRALGGIEVRSPLSGQRALRREILEKVKRLETGWGIEVGLTIDALQAGFRVVEVPVPMTHAETGRTIGGFLHRFRQFLGVMAAICRRIPLTRIWAQGE